MKNVGVRTKILIPIIGLGIIVILMVVMSYNGMSSIMSASTEIAENYSPSQSMAGNFESYFQILQKDAYAHIVANDASTYEGIESEISDTTAELDAIIEEFEAGLDKGTQEDDLFEAFKDTYEEFIPVLSELIEKSTSGDDDAAMSIANNEITQLGLTASEQLVALKQYEDDAMDAAIADSKNTYNIAVAGGIAISVIGIVLVVLSIMCANFLIVKPLLSMNRDLVAIVDEIAAKKGDLTKRIGIDGKDELGCLAGGINTFIETLQGIMAEITKGAVDLETIVNKVSGSVSAANGSSCDISAAMEELSASMEEVSATTAGVNEKITNLGTDGEQLASASTDLRAYADEMEKRADELQNTAVTNKNNTNTVIENILSSLSQAIEDSKSVERVNDLTNQILDISSQTNLLALNASIEAARAGEAGKGFAVVADEIRQLADSSRETAGNIQNINNMVTSAVHELVKNADEMIKYINETILSDYDGFVQSGSQYRNDAVHVNEVVTQFSEMSTRVQQFLREIMEAVQGITASIEESTNAVTTSAMNTNELVDGISQISVEMENNSEIAVHLKTEADRFVNL